MNIEMIDATYMDTVSDARPICSRNQVIDTDGDTAAEDDAAGMSNVNIMSKEKCFERATRRRIVAAGGCPTRGQITAIHEAASKFAASGMREEPGLTAITATDDAGAGAYGYSAEGGKQAEPPSSGNPPTKFLRAASIDGLMVRRGHIKLLIEEMC